LDTYLFQECVYKARTGLDDLEIHRLGSILEREGKVKYYDFLTNFKG
jgi:hypothetical protein